MNPVDLIRELAEALHEETQRSEYGPADWQKELLTRAQSFLAAQPVVVELGECGIVAGSNKKRWLVRDSDRGRFNVLDLGLGCPEEPASLAGVAGNTEGKNAIPCVAHVVVTPGVR